MQTIASYLPIAIIGAGGIVQDSHLPAYTKGGFRVKAIMDLDVEKATQVAQRYGIEEVYDSVEKLVAACGTEVVYDLAVPGKVHASVLQLLPDNVAVLIQKPMGDDLEQANEIIELCRKKRLRGAVNFQLRYAPAVVEAKKLISSGIIGELVDVDINVNVYTPWHLWPFLFGAPRMEILYHSIHYLDLVRHLMGEPEKLIASSSKHPQMANLSSVKSTLLMKFGAWKRALIHTNHSHFFGRKHQHSYIKLEGTKGAIRIVMGVLLDYPKGEPDVLEYSLVDETGAGEWQTVSLAGNWFPDAFIGSMEEVLKVEAGLKSIADNSVEDAILTMEWVERSYTDLAL